MANNVKIIYNNQSYSFPIIEGSENEKAIDIKQLRSKTGFITYDPGYKNTGHCISNITYLDGENGILRYRGYSIEELCKKTTFLEVCYLLIFGELPTKQQLDKFQFDINKESLVDEHVKEIFHSLSRSDVNISYFVAKRWKFQKNPVSESRNDIHPKRNRIITGLDVEKNNRDKIGNIIDWFLKWEQDRDTIEP